MELQLPLVSRFHARARACAIEPREGLGVPSQVRIPKCGGERKNHLVMIRIARLMVTRQRTVRKDRVLGVVENEFVLGSAMKRGVHCQPRVDIRLTDG